MHEVADPDELLAVVGAGDEHHRGPQQVFARDLGVVGRVRLDSGVVINRLQKFMMGLGLS